MASLILLNGKPVTQQQLETAATTRTLSEIAREIRKEWGAKVNYGAKPYLEAMLTLTSMSDTFGCDSAKTIVNYFLSNATAFRGEAAKRIKLELNKMAKATPGY